jgi:site-specific DNA-methyltransferase (adenine-specific)
VAEAVLHHGDCLAVLPTLADGSVDCILTDPPYSSGGAFRGDRLMATTEKCTGWSRNPDGSSRPPTRSSPAFTGDTRDQRGYAYWCAMWLSECRRITRAGGMLLMFTDWRQLPTTTDAIQAGGWVWRGIVVWDKGIGRPNKGRFRNHVEYVVWGSNGPIDGEENPIYPSSIFRHAPPPPGERQHLTEKPVELLVDLLAICPPGGTVLDPFMGSGTTGVACIQTGRRFIGIELDSAYFAVAKRRIEEADGKGGLFEKVADPPDLFAAAGD